MEMICRFGILLNINAQPGIDGDGSERCFREFLRSTSRSNVLTQKNFLNWEKILIFLEKLISFFRKNSVTSFFCSLSFELFRFRKDILLEISKLACQSYQGLRGQGILALGRPPIFH